MIQTPEARLNNVKSRINKVSLINGKYLYDVFLTEVKKHGIEKLINRKLNPKYIELAEVICKDMEYENGVYVQTIRVDELKKEKNKEHNIVGYDTENLLQWIQDKQIEFSEMCRISIEMSKKNLYQIFTNVLKYYPMHNDNRLSGDFDYDIGFIIDEYVLRRKLVSTYISATIGSVWIQ